MVTMKPPPDRPESNEGTDALETTAKIDAGAAKVNRTHAARHAGTLSRARSFACS
jgi:hypothetical protein